MRIKFLVICLIISAFAPVNAHQAAVDEIIININAISGNVWSGGFLDNTAIWKGHIDANAKILGSFSGVLFPQGIMANSPTQPLCDATKGQTLDNKLICYTLNNLIR